MKKIISLLLAFCMVLGLAACSSSAPADGTTAAPAGDDKAAYKIGIITGTVSQG